MIGEAAEQASAIRLSICIPTYNFAQFIGETLESIAPHVVEGVEVVILDGGSTDDTSTVVESFKERLPGLSYHRRPQRGGIDRDMAHTVELARGDYCWLFSADDLMKPGAITEMLGEISSGLDVYLCGFTRCTFDMNTIKDQPILRAPAGSTFDLGRDHDRRRYFESALTTNPFFSFLGSMVFKKARWDALPLDENFVGSCWAHVARFFRMIHDGLQVKYLGKSYLRKRSDNDSFLQDGLIKRYALTIDGYHLLADTFFGHGSLEAHHIRRVVAREYTPREMLYAKMLSRDAPPEQRMLLERLVRKTYADQSLRNKLSLAAYRVVPLLLFKALAIPYMALRKALHKR
jgi:abequosyltransferase